MTKRQLDLVFYNHFLILKIIQVVAPVSLRLITHKHTINVEDFNILRR